MTSSVVYHMVNGEPLPVTVGASSCAESGSVELRIPLESSAGMSGRVRGDVRVNPNLIAPENGRRDQGIPE